MRKRPDYIMVMVFVCLSQAIRSDMDTYPQNLMVGFSLYLEGRCAYYSDTLNWTVVYVWFRQLFSFPRFKIHLYLCKITSVWITGRQVFWFIQGFGIDRFNCTYKAPFQFDKCATFLLSICKTILNIFQYYEDAYPLKSF